MAAALVGPKKDAVPYVRAEAATALVRHDSAYVRAVLVQALEDEDPMVRRAAINALFRIAYTYHGFDPEGDEESRKAAVDRWKLWLRER